MRRACAALTVLAVLVGCDSRTPTSPTRPPAATPAPTDSPSVQVAELTVSGDGHFTALTQIRQFTANARMSDASQRDVTAESVWVSSNSEVVSVSSRGEVMSAGVGLATISAAAFGWKANLDVSVAPVDQSRISGLYRLAFTASAECSDLPDWARHREYDALLDQSAATPNGIVGILLTVQLQPGYAPQFSGSIEGSRVGFWFPTDDPLSYYYYGDPVFSHHIDDARTYTVRGHATGTKGGSPDVQIAGTFDGFIRAVDPITDKPIAECHRGHSRFTLVRR